MSISFSLIFIDYEPHTIEIGQFIIRPSSHVFITQYETRYMSLFLKDKYWLYPILINNHLNQLPYTMTTTLFRMAWTIITKTNLTHPSTRQSHFHFKNITCLIKFPFWHYITKDSIDLGFDSHMNSLYANKIIPQGLIPKNVPENEEGYFNNSVRTITYKFFQHASNLSR